MCSISGEAMKKWRAGAQSSVAFWGGATNTTGHSHNKENAAKMFPLESIKYTCKTYRKIKTMFCVEKWSFIIS